MNISALIKALFAIKERNGDFEIGKIYYDFNKFEIAAFRGYPAYVVHKGDGNIEIAEICRNEFTVK